MMVIVMSVVLNLIHTVDITITTRDDLLTHHVDLTLCEFNSYCNKCYVNLNYFELLIHTTWSHFVLILTIHPSPCGVVGGSRSCTGCC